jgi:hypothetical protein
MQIHLHVHDGHCVLSVSGSVGTVDVPGVRARMLAVLNEHDGDLLVDMRQAGPVSDHLAGALTAAYTRAKDSGRYVVVIDDARGATAACLRRQRMHMRIPMHRDSADALSGLRGSRDAEARRCIGVGPPPSDDLHAGSRAPGHLSPVPNRRA